MTKKASRCFAVLKNPLREYFYPETTIKQFNTIVKIALHSILEFAILLLQCFAIHIKQMANQCQVLQFANALHS
jgi:hypothetical protein